VTRFRNVRPAAVPLLECHRARLIQWRRRSRHPWRTSTRAPWRPVGHLCRAIKVPQTHVEEGEGYGSTEKLSDQGSGR